MGYGPPVRKVSRTIRAGSGFFHPARDAALEVLDVCVARAAGIGRGLLPGRAGGTAAVSDDQLILLGRELLHEAFAALAVVDGGVDLVLGEAFVAVDVDDE